MFGKSSNGDFTTFIYFGTGGFLIYCDIIYTGWGSGFGANGITN